MLPCDQPGRMEETKMSKHTTTNTKAQPTTPPARDWDGPAHATLESVIIGSTDKALGVGVMDATGKDGTTTGYLVSLVRTRPNGKKVIYPLQDLVKDMPKAFARTYNAYTKLYKTRLDALRKCAALASEYNWELLDAEKEEVATLKSEGKWKVEKKKKTPKTDIERNLEASKRAVGAINDAPSPWGVLLDALAGVDVLSDKEVLVIPILRLLHGAVTVDIEVLEGILDNAARAIIAENEKTAQRDAGANK